MKKLLKPHGAIRFRIIEESRLFHHLGCILFFLAVLSVSVLPSLAQAEPKTIRIVHVNDFHGFAQPTRSTSDGRTLGGAAALAGRIDQLRSDESIPLLLLSAGDMIQGNNWANLTQGRSVIELMNLMRFDAMTIGNHEMDFGQEVLKKRIGEAHFPMLAANVDGMPGLKPYVVLNAGKIRVAVIGVVTEDTPIASNPLNMTGLTFTSPKSAVQRYLPELRREAEIVIVLSHIGHQNDLRLAGEVSGIDVIVGGHSHTRVDVPALINNTLVLQAWEHEKTLGILDITIDNGRIVNTSSRLEEVDPASPQPDKEVGDLVSKYDAMSASTLGREIGVALCDLDGRAVRQRETNLGNFIADVIRDTAGADAALINGGSIRTGLPKGAIRVKDIYSIVPFDNYIVAIRMKGSLLRQALEHAVSGNEADNPGAFPQISGIRFSYDSALPPGNRIREIYVGGKPLDPDREYVVATQDFIVAGGDGFKAFGDAIRSSRDFAVVGGALKGEKLVYNNAARWLRDVVVDYIERQKQIDPQTDGRIKKINQ